MLPQIVRMERFLCCLMLSYLLGIFYDKAVRKHLQKPELPGIAWMMAGITAAFIIRYGYSLLTLRCILISQILLAAGAYDAITYEIPDIFHILLLLAGTIGFRWLPALMGFLLVPLPFFIAAVCTNGKIGGGDVKLMMAAGFAMGVTLGFKMMIWGLLLAILWNQISQRNEASLPLAPFLGAGGFLVLLMDL